MERNGKYEIVKCPHCEKDVTHIAGTDSICPYCGKSLKDQPEKESKLQKVKQYILKNKMLIFITACLIICTLAMSGTVSSAISERDRMLNQLQELTEQYDDLQSNFDALSAQHDDLYDTYNALEAELANYKDQQDTIDDLNAQLTDLQEQYDELVAENEELKEQVEEAENSSGGGGGGAGSGGGTLYISSASDNSSSSSSSGGGMVWLSATGSKYHSIPDCGNMNPNNAYQVSKSSAEAQGYDACSKCW